MSQGCDSDYTGYRERSWPRERKDEFLAFTKKAFEAQGKFKSRHDLVVWVIKNCVPDTDLSFANDYNRFVSSLYCNLIEGYTLIYTRDYSHFMLSEKGED